MNNLNKLRILRLYAYLLKNTDAEHPLSTIQLTKILKEQYGITVARNTICNDLRMLHESGMHIEHYSLSQNEYYYDGQIFDNAELKILIDAVASSKFITQKKSEELIKKLLSLTVACNAEKLHRHVCVDGRVKSGNERGYYIVDAITDAIDIGRKIRFRYTDYDVNKQRNFCHDGEVLTVTPYTLTWDGDYYYMRGYCDNRNAMRTYRLDRIDAQPEITDEPGVPVPDDFNVAAYSKSVFRMFESEQTIEVKLEGEAAMIKYLIDFFGMKVDTRPIDDNHFEANVNVCASPTFYAWVFQFGGKIQIIGPEEVKEEYQEMACRAMHGNY